MIFEAANGKQVSLRNAAYQIAVDRRTRACRERGWV